MSNRSDAICRNFAAGATCARPRCRYSHTLIDTSRFHALVGDIPTHSAESEKTYFLVECIKHSATDSDTADADAIKWRMRLLGGGRATLAADGVGSETISVQPTYPLKGQGQEAGVALSILEGRVFGRSPLPNLTRSSVCRQFQDGVCRYGATSCRYSHTLFDLSRFEALLDEAVQKRGYADYRPLIEAEYIARPGTAQCIWRVTLRCVLAYHQKSAPQPVVVTGPTLETAMRLLENQFAGKPTRPHPHPRASRKRGCTPFTSSPQSREPSATSSTNGPPRSSSHSTSTSNAAGGTSQSYNAPPPSYSDATGGNPLPQPSYAQNTKRGF